MALSQDEIKILREFKSKGYSKEDFKNYLVQKRQDDFLNSMKQPKVQISVSEKNQKNTNNYKAQVQSEDRQGWDFGVNIGEGIGNFGKSIKFESKDDDRWYHSVGKFIGNLPGNALQIGGGVVGAVSNPVGTGEAIKEAGAGVIENGMNKVLSTDIGADSLRWLGDKLGADKENVERNIDKARNGGFYTTEARKNIGQGLDKFGNDLKNKPLRTIEKLAVENPIDVLTLGTGVAASTSSKLGKMAKVADTAGDIQKAQKYTKFANIANKTSDILNPINVAKNVYIKPIKAVGKGAGSTLKTLTSRISGLNPETMKNIVKNPELFRKVEAGFLNKENLANKVVKSIDERITEVGELGKKYENIKKWTGNFDASKIIPRKILEKYDIKITKKGLDFTNSSIGSITNQNAITNAFNIIKSRKITSGKDVLNLRRALDDVINYKSEATDLAKNIVRELRRNVDDVAKTQIPELNLLDKKFGSEIGELQKIKKYIFNSDGTLKDDYIQKISTLTGNGKEKTLERIKKLVPEIEHEINALKAFSDVELAKGNKVGNYMQALSGAGGFAFGGVPGAIAGAIISNPSVVANLLKHYGASKKYISNISNKIKNGIKLGPKESATISKIFQSQIIADKLDNFASKVGGKMNFMPEGSKSSNNINFGEKIPDNAIERLKNSIGTSKNEKLNINIISNKTKRELERNGIDSSKYKGHRITTNGIKHILKGHGEKANLSIGEIPVTMEDIKKIPLIIKNADEVKVSEKLSNSGKKVIIYKKDIGHIFYYLEYIDDDSGFLTTQTMYKKEVD